MFTIENEHLAVQLLDPDNDPSYLGSRYCSAGYVFQVTDKRLGPLLAGPTFPESFNTFDGQGIPDSFSLAPLRGRDANRALVIGVGVCDLETFTVLKPCTWKVELRTRAVRFSTRHAFETWEIELQREVTLDERTLRSHTSVSNVGAARMAITWFPHPFFPQLPDGDDELVKLNFAVSVPDDSSYTMSSNGFIRRNGWPWTTGQYQALDFARGSDLVLIQRHPVLGQISASCDFTPTYFPIWGNENTFSWEPMIDRTIAPSQTATWHIDYNF